MMWGRNLQNATTARESMAAGQQWAKTSRPLRQRQRVAYGATGVYAFPMTVETFDRKAVSSGKKYPTDGDA